MTDNTTQPVGSTQPTQSADAGTIVVPGVTDSFFVSPDAFVPQDIPVVTLTDYYGPGVSGPTMPSTPLPTQPKSGLPAVVDSVLNAPSTVWDWITGTGDGVSTTGDGVSTTKEVKQSLDKAGIDPTITAAIIGLLYSWYEGGKMRKFYKTQQEKAIEEQKEANERAFEQQKELLEMQYELEKGKGGPAVKVRGARTVFD